MPFLTSREDIRHSACQRQAQVGVRDVLRRVYVPVMDRGTPALVPAGTAATEAMGLLRESRFVHFPKVISLQFPGQYLALEDLADGVHRPDFEESEKTLTAILTRIVLLDESDLGASSGIDASSYV
jgi:hypothetical protein